MDLEPTRPPRDRGPGLRQDQLEQDIGFDPSKAMHALLDGVGPSQLLPRADLKELFEADLHTLEHGLSPETLQPAFAAARDVELKSKARSHLHKTGTLQQYSAAVSRLACEDATGDAYRAYDNKQHTIEWPHLSRSTRYRMRAGLGRQATDTVLQWMPVYLSAAADHKATEEAFEQNDTWSSAFYTHPSHQPFSTEDLLELARAADFLRRYPPDPHGRRARAEQNAPGNKKRSPSKTHQKTDVAITLSTPDDDLDAMLSTEILHDSLFLRQAIDRSKGKRRVLTRMHKIAAKRESEGVDCDWRGEIWAQVERDRYLDDEKKAALAVMIAIGCRPAALVEGPELHLLKTGPDSENDRIIIKVPPTKASTCEIFGDHDPSLRLTEADQDEIEELRQDEAVQGFNSKGQRWAYYDIEAGTPETKWLAKHIRRNGCTQFLVTPDAYDDEKPLLDILKKRTERRWKVRWQHDFRQQHTAAQLTEAEKTRRIVNGMGAKINKLAVQAFPELKRGKAKVTGYVFRHAWSTDLKEAAESPEEVSQAMSHQSGRTASLYGTRRQAQSPRSSRKNRARFLRGVKVAHTSIRSPVHRPERGGLVLN